MYIYFIGLQYVGIFVWVIFVLDLSFAHMRAHTHTHTHTQNFHLQWMSALPKSPIWNNHLVSTHTHTHTHTHTYTHLGMFPRKWLVTEEDTLLSCGYRTWQNSQTVCGSMIKGQVGMRLPLWDLEPCLQQMLASMCRSVVWSVLSLCCVSGDCTVRL